MREKPTIVLFTAWSSTTAPSPPTTYRSTSARPPGWNADTVPRSGAATYVPPSSLCVPTGGTARVETTETPTRITNTATLANTTRLRRPRLPTRTSGASPDAASMPVAATPASTTANSRSSQSGVVPRWIVSITRPGWNSVASPTTTITTQTARNVSPTRSTARALRMEMPRTFDQPTHNIATAAITISAGQCPALPQNAAR